MKRGRPKGSKNKPKPAATRVAATGWAPRTERAYALCVRIIELEDELKRLHVELRRIIVPTPPPAVIARNCNCGAGMGNPWSSEPHLASCSFWRSGAGF